MKNHALYKKFFIAFMLTCSMLLACSAEAQPSYERPSWVGISAKLSLMRNPKVTNIKHPDYWQLKISVTYKNNSKNKVLTAILKKDLFVKFKMGAIDHYRNNLGQNSREMRYTDVISSKVSSTRVSKVEVYPGQSTQALLCFTH